MSPLEVALHHVCVSSSLLLHWLWVDSRERQTLARCPILRVQLHHLRMQKHGQMKRDPNQLVALEGQLCDWGTFPRHPQMRKWEVLLGEELR